MYSTIPLLSKSEISSLGNPEDLFPRDAAHMSLVLKKKRSLGLPTRSDTNRAVQSLNMARGLKFRIQKVEGLYYPCSENKGADQREADLRLCFRICKKTVFSRCGSYSILHRCVIVISLVLAWPLSRKHLRTKVTPDFHLTYGKNGGNLGSESK